MENMLPSMHQTLHTPRPGLSPIPNTIPLTISAALAPPLMYYIALLLLPPLYKHDSIIAVIRNAFAIISGWLFFRLPVVYHVPFSVGLTYQLALVGLYGGCRVLDAFFISPYVFQHIPRRVQYHHVSRPSTPGDVQGSSYLDVLQSKHIPVTETAVTDQGLPTTWSDRASWALELELSMRGVGFTWNTADVRHTKKTWRPTIGNRLHSIFIHCVPVLAISWAIIYDIYVMHLHGESARAFDDLPIYLQLLLTAALGAFLMCAFSVGHSAFAIVLAPLAPHPLSFFPPLYTTRVWDITSVRGFWSFGWHRLFARLFLVYGVWPGEWLERQILGKSPHEPADVGKVLGGFLSSAFVHSFAVRAVVGGDWKSATGEAKFFGVSGFAVILEEIVKRAVLTSRKRNDSRGKRLHRWYDSSVGCVWWISVLLYSGRNFARGWVQAGLVREMAGL